MATTINNTTVGIYTIPDATGVLAIQNSGATVQTIGTNQSTTFAGTATMVTGGLTTAPLTFTSGTLLTSTNAGTVNYDGASFYGTVDTSTGCGPIPVFNEYRLIAAGSTVGTTIANYFGTTSNIPLVPNAYYEIEVVMFFLKTTAGTVTLTLTNSAAPTSQDVYFEMSPITGVVAPPGTATMLKGQVFNDATAALAYTTGSISNGVNNYARFRILLTNGAGTSLKIQATCSAGSLTPGIGSFWSARRLPATNNGTYAA